MIRLLALTAAVVLFVGAVRVLVFAPTDVVDPAVDAVLVLGGGIAGERLARGLEVLAQSPDAVMILSVPFDEAYLDCRDRVVLPDGTDRGLRCLRPQPATTTGEVSTLARMATTEGWGHVAVVTSTTHVARAGIVFRACDGLRVDLHEAPVAFTEPRIYWRMITEIPSLLATLTIDRPTCQR